MATTCTPKGYTSASASSNSLTLASISLSAGNSIIVCVGDPDAQSISSVTWNGQSLSLVDSGVDPGDAKASIYSLHNVSGATGDVVVTWGGNTTDRWLAAFELSNGNYFTDDTSGNTDGNINTPVSITTDASVTQADCVCISALADNTTISAAGQDADTLYGDTDLSAISCAAGYEVHSAASGTLTAEFTTGGRAKLGVTVAVFYAMPATIERSANDTVDISDSFEIERDTHRKIEDTLAEITDAVARELQAERTVEDTLDAIPDELALEGDFLREIEDADDITDDLAKEHDAHRKIDDTLAEITDAVSAGLELEKAVEDTLAAIPDELALEGDFLREVEEVEVISDEVAFELIAQRTIEDTLSAIPDEVTVQKESVIERSVEDSLEISDDAVRAVDWRRLVSDAITISDTLVAGIPQPPSFVLPLNNSGLGHLETQVLSQNPYCRYYGQDASTDGWLAGGYGTDLTYTGSGSAIEFDLDTPFLNDSDKAVRFNGGYKFVESTVLTIGTDDFVLEAVLKQPDGIAAQETIFSTLSSTGDDEGVELYWDATGQLTFYIDDGSTNATLTIGSADDYENGWIHLMIFCNRDWASSSGMRAYVDGLYVNGVQPSGVSGSMTPTSAWQLGADQDGSNVCNAQLAYFAFYKSSSWLGTDASVWDAEADERFCKMAGIYPEVAGGTILPTNHTRSSHAMLDKIDADGYRRYFQVGPNWTRLVERPDDDDVPRRGVLCERDGGTNPWSTNDFTTSWTDNNGVTTNDVVEGVESGETNCAKFVADDNADAHYLYSGSITTTSTEPYTVSVFLKAGDQDWVEVRVDKSTDAYRWFNVGSSPAVGATANGTTNARIEDWGDGWRRCSFRCAMDASFVLRLTAGVAAGDGDGDTTFAGDLSTTTFEVGFAQSMRECWQYSWVPDTSTMAKDLLTFKGDDGNLGGVGSNQEATTEFLVLYEDIEIESGFLSVFLDIYDATDPAGDWIWIGVLDQSGTDYANTRGEAGTSEQWDIWDSGDSITDNNQHHYRVTYQSNSAKFWVDDALIGSEDTTVTAPDNLDVIAVGCKYTTGGNEAMFPVSDVRIFPAPSTEKNPRITPDVLAVSDGAYVEVSNYDPSFRVEFCQRNGVGLLDPELEINSVTEEPQFRYNGKIATASVWPSWSYGEQLAIGGSGSDPTPGQFSPLLGASDGAVLFNGAKYFAAATSGFADVTTEDIVIELVFRMPSTSGLRMLEKRKSAADYNGWTVFNNAGFLTLYLDSGASQIGFATGALTAGCWYHAMAFADRSGSGAWYVNGLASGTPVSLASVTGSLTNSEYMWVGAASAFGPAAWTDPIAYIAMWMKSAWLDTHLQAAVAAERFYKMCGIWPQLAEGTAAPVVATRDDIAHLDHYDSDGNRRLFQVGPNWPRICERPDADDAVHRGLLQESERENICLESETIDVAGTWPVTRCSVTNTSTTTAPDGTTTSSDVIHEDNSDNNHYIKQNIALVTATRYTFSCWAKAINRTQISINPGISNTVCLFNLSTGAIVSEGSAATAYIEDWGNGWYRCCIRFLSDTSGVVSHYIFPAEGGSASFQGLNQDSIYVWGFQEEAGGFASSYIKTTTVAETRVADDLYYKGDDGNLGEPGGSGRTATLLLRFMTRPASLNRTDNAYLLALSDDGSADDRVSLHISLLDTIGTYGIAGGTTWWNSTSGGDPENGLPRELALSYELNSIYTSVDGERTLKDSDAQVSDELDRIVVGGPYSTAVAGRADDLILLVEITPAADQLAFHRFLDEAIVISDGATAGLVVSRVLSDTADVSDVAQLSMDYLREIEETVSLADTIAAGLEQLRVIADALSAIPDEIATEGDFARVLTDADTITDQAARGIEAGRSVSDTVEISDQAATALVYARIIADVLSAIPDTVARELDEGGGEVFERSASDAEDISDSVMVVMEYLRAAADTADIADSVSRTAAMGRDVSDTLDAVDTVLLALEYARAAADAVSIGDEAATALEYGREASDAVSISDTIATAIALALIVSDSVNISDQAARSLEAGRIASDAVAISDAATTASDALRQIADTLDVSDQAAPALELDRAASDAALISDEAAAALEFERAVSDAMSIADTVLRAVQWAKTVADTLNVSDAATTEQQLGRAASDAVDVTDEAATAMELERAASDVLVVTDAVATAAEVFRQISDTLDISDTATTDAVWERVVSDVLATIPDQATRTATFGRIVTEAGLSLADSVQRVVDWVREISDTVEISDQSIIETGAQLVEVDAVAITDTILREVWHVRGAEDAVAIADSLSASVERERTVSDSLSISDAVSLSRALARLASDAVSITDQTGRELDASRAASDALGVTDTAETAMFFARAIADALGVTDSVARQKISSVAIERVVTDALNITDEANRAVWYVRTVSEAVGVTDDAQTAMAYERVVSDTLVALDAATAGRELAMAASDVLGISDQASVALELARVVLESVSLIDGLSVAMEYNRDISEVIEVSDQATRGLELVLVVLDALSVSDQVTAGLERGVAVSDVVGILDQAVRAVEYARGAEDALEIGDEVVISTGLVEVIVEDFLDVADDVSIGMELARDIVDILTSEDALALDLQPTPRGITDAVTLRAEIAEALEVRAERIRPSVRASLARWLEIKRKSTE